MISDIVPTGVAATLMWSLWLRQPISDLLSCRTPLETSCDQIRNYIRSVGNRLRLVRWNSLRWNSCTLFRFTRWISAAFLFNMPWFPARLRICIVHHHLTKKLQTWSFVFWKPIPCSLQCKVPCVNSNQLPLFRSRISQLKPCNSRGHIFPFDCVISLSELQCLPCMFYSVGYILSLSSLHFTVTANYSPYCWYKMPLGTFGTKYNKWPGVITINCNVW